ncbi:hypothetical protein BG418_34450 [Streptomyces sp. CBMA152]|nr:hypothetical protein [Streptomyces sp. CBMA152]
MPLVLGAENGGNLDLVEGWGRRWSVTWCVEGSELSCPVSAIADVPVRRAEPVRHFSWHPRQRHRPGLEAMVTTRRLHGFESLEERKFLRAVDFAGSVRGVLSQPFRLRFKTVAGKVRSHIPDYLVVMPDGRWLVDVRPARRADKAEDRECFAAARELAAAAGWQYSVVSGWRPQVVSALEAMRAEARPMSHLLDLQARMMGLLESGGMPFGELVEATRLPVVARAHVLHLLWHRRVGVDLASPLLDGAIVALPQGRPW